MSRGLSLAAHGLSRRFRTGFEVRVDSLEVAAGNTLALLGPSGSGKSTLLALLGLLERPDAGRILLDGREVAFDDNAARLTMAAVFQRPYLIKGSVSANVEYGLKLRRVPASERSSRVEAALERVGLGSFGGRSAATLSGGEAQRVALARALVLEPRVLLLDEPLASLDPLLKRRLVADFASILRAEGVTVVYVTHDHDEALVIADHIAVMNEGGIVTKGAAADVMGLPADEWTAEFLGMEQPARGTIEESAEGLMRITAEGVDVLASGSLGTGTRVLFAVAPEDVMLAGAGIDVGPLSARNRLTGRVVRVEPRGTTWRVVVDLGGWTVASSVSRAALDELGIDLDQPVQVVFKSSAVRTRTA